MLDQMCSSSERKQRRRHIPDTARLKRFEAARLAGKVVDTNTVHHPACNLPYLTAAAAGNSYVAVRGATMTLVLRKSESSCTGGRISEAPKEKWLRKNEGKALGRTLTGVS